MQNDFLTLYDALKPSERQQFVQYISVFYPQEHKILELSTYLIDMNVKNRTLKNIQNKIFPNSTETSTIIYHLLNQTKEILIQFISNISPFDDYWKKKNYLTFLLNRRVSFEFVDKTIIQLLKKNQDLYKKSKFGELDTFYLESVILENNYINNYINDKEFKVKQASLNLYKEAIIKNALISIIQVFYESYSTRLFNEKNEINPIEFNLLKSIELFSSLLPLDFQLILKLVFYYISFDKDILNEILNITNKVKYVNTNISYLIIKITFELYVNGDRSVLEIMMTVRKRIGIIDKENLSNYFKDLFTIAKYQFFAYQKIDQDIIDEINVLSEKYFNKFIYLEFALLIINFYKKDFSFSNIIRISKIKQTADFNYEYNFRILKCIIYFESKDLISLRNELLLFKKKFINTKTDKKIKSVVKNTIAGFYIILNLKKKNKEDALKDATIQIEKLSPLALEREWFLHKIIEFQNE